MVLRSLVRLRARSFSQGKPVQAFEPQAALRRKPSLPSHPCEWLLHWDLHCSANGPWHRRCCKPCHFAPVALRALQPQAHEGGEIAQSLARDFRPQERRMPPCSRQGLRIVGHHCLVRERGSLHRVCPWPFEG